GRGGARGQRRRGGSGPRRGLSRGGVVSRVGRMVLPILIAAVLAVGVAGPAVRARDSSTLLAGFGIKVVGVGLDVSYDSPSAPVPLSPSPTAELAFGYSLATLDAGPIGHALASVLW